MRRQSLSRILARTLDYLARRHPWFDAIQRRRVLAAFMVLGYGAMVLLLVWQVHGGKDDGWVELLKTYSALFFDLLVLFLLSVVFLLVRGYYLEEKTRINTTLLPDKRFFFPLTVPSVHVHIDSEKWFARHPAVDAILEALPLDQSDFFLAHAGSLDIPKLTLCRLEQQPDKSVSLHLGIASFREFFFTHHFADYGLSRSSSRDSGEKETLRSLFGPIYERNYLAFFRREQLGVDLLKYTPNTLGLTGCVQVVSEGRSAFFMQRRGYHESAARGVLQLSYAGTLNAYPNYADQTGPVTLDMLANDEFTDEFMSSAAGRYLAVAVQKGQVRHELIGFCINSQYLFQPELFVMTTITVERPSLVTELLQAFGAEKGGKFVALASLKDVNECLAKSQLKLRPLCQVAIDALYIPHLDARDSEPATAGAFRQMCS